MNIWPEIGERICRTTVRLTCELTDGGLAYGTAFLFHFLHDGDESIPCLVTNRHVVENAKVGRFAMTVRAGAREERPTIQDYSLEDFEDRWTRHPDRDVDLAVMPIGPILNEATRTGSPLENVVLDAKAIPSKADLDALPAIEDVVMVGYPIGLADDVNNRPIVRKGITATPPRIDYEGKPEFLIDIACFGGSSGSPIFLFQRGMTAVGGDTGVSLGMGRIVQLLGILYGGFDDDVHGELVKVPVPTRRKRDVPRVQVPANLGCVIKSHRLLEFEPMLRAWKQKAKGASGG